MNIDWSKAPEGCLEVGKNQWDELAWLCADGYIYHHCNGCMVNWKVPRALKRSDFDVVDIRPEEEWSGEGLPPVGTVCEYGQSPRWQQVTVIAHWLNGGDLCPVAQVPNNGPICMGELKYFRPVRTAEQIAAEERKQEILEMIDSFGLDTAIWGRDAVMEICGHLWEKGYRKQEQK